MSLTKASYSMINGAPVNVLDFGAVGNGSTDDSAAMLAANTASFNVNYPAGLYYVNTNITLTSSITMQPGASFLVASGKTLTINGAVYAGSRQYIFNGASGAVAGTFGNVALWADWFGAIPDSSISATPTGTDSGIPINKAILAATNTGAKKGVVLLNSGVYLIATGIVSNYAGIVIQGTGKYNTNFTCSSGFTGYVMTMAGAGGPPNNVKGIGFVSAVGGSYSGGGLDVFANGTFTSDIWVSGFAVGMLIRNTDCFLTDFAIELNLTGLKITSPNVNVSHGTTYANQAFGVLVADVLTNEPGAVTLSGIRSTSEPATGFNVTNSSYVIFNACSAASNVNTDYTVSGFLVDGTSTNIQINNCTAVLKVQSTTGIGFKINGAPGNIAITNCRAEKFNKGVYVNTTGNATITSGQFLTNALYGIHSDAYNFLIVSNNQCDYEGTAAGADAGIFITANTAAQRLLCNGNICGSTGGGTQEYGIRVTCTNATSYGIVSNNVTPFNSVGGVVIDGANLANITISNNIN